MALCGSNWALIRARTQCIPPVVAESQFRRGKATGSLWLVFDGFREVLAVLEGVELWRCEVIVNRGGLQLLHGEDGLGVEVLGFGIQVHYG